MRVTIREVARAAGVSVATVSRVLNESGPVAGETRDRIRRVAGEMRYIPNDAARSLSMRRTGTLGVLLPDLYGEFFSEVIRGLDQAAQRARFHLLLSSSHNNRHDIEAALQAMRGRVDGLVVMSPHIDVAVLAANLPESLPAVMLNTPQSTSEFDTLSVDNFGGARAMVGHLAGHGHQRIAMVRGPQPNHDAEERLRGYRTALVDAGITPDAALEAEGDFTEESGYRAVRRLLELRRPPTAIFAANDSTAIGAMSALREAGVSVPSAMAVAGFDDIPISRYLTPALSSVRVSINDLGARAMEQLVRAVEEQNRHERVHQTLPTTLVIRDSCGVHGGDRG
ncbi:MAG TPA: LacI family DNA-binding transcriptional regulator [Longimicrobium sp.]|jgi:LacI family transcriptional regulator|nr:LacI family DNA-binding transcriptional regulator [Longimicrobium sp.]